jgi:hypothetical protein
MAWKMSEKPRTVLASRSLIEEFDQMEPAPYDRPMSERRLQVYERIWMAGEFRTVVWASAVCGETNNTYRINGKHTSKMLSGKTAKEIEDHPLHVTVERYFCDKLSDVANLYNTFDSQLASRSNRDVNMAFAAAVGMSAIPTAYIHNTVTAAAYLKWTEGELRKVSPAEKAEELMDRQSFIKWLADVLPSTSTRGTVGSSGHLMRSPVITAMMSTYDRAGPNLSRQFWVAVRDESAPDRNDASRTLARYLVRAKLRGGSAKDARKVVPFREMYVKCLHAWNAWRKKETTNLNYYPQADIPEVSK